MSITERPFADLTDVTLADDDTNSMLTVMSPDDQMLNQFANIARGTTDPVLSL